MNEVVVHPRPEIRGEIRKVDIPSPKPDELIIKVEVAGSNVKDWAHITTRNLSINSGDDIAGFVYALGKDVQVIGEFHVGDRVAAFHPMLKPGGAYAQYAVAPCHTVFHIPKTVSFEEAATIPLVSMTAAIAMYRCQGLPPPWSARTSLAPPLPIIIYGASSSLGCFAIKLAKASNIHPIIAIAGGNYEYVSELINPSKGDIIVDYRQGPEKMKVAVKAALGSLDPSHAFDCISEKGTWIPLTQMVAQSGGQVSVVSGANAYDETEIPAGVTIKYVYVGVAHDGAYISAMPKQPADKEASESAIEFAYVFFRYLTRMLSKGACAGHPYEVVPGGLNGVEVGLRKLKDGKSRGKKFVYRIEETSDLDKAAVTPYFLGF